ncbi:1,4-alpha-glucan branching protein GlgB, partial [Fibrobacter sp. UBA4297]|uniref:1,4-alpha-glucan branching protein GlgB n=1 Tax=Fibrobacter sp. UBA4297 TaxID=1946536 RepID=UPI0025B7E655
MEWNDFTSLTAENMQAIWDFKTKDPFSILGIHPLETDRGIKTVIRTYQPQACFVRGESCDGTEEFDFVKLGDTGFFEAILDLEYKPFFYKLIIKQADGIEYTLVDPYAFLPVLSDFDRHLIATGTHYELYRKLGANIIEHQGFKGVHFAVWAPNAHAVSVVGNFNSWDGRRHQMRMLGASGIWEIFIPNLGENELYRFEIHGADGQLHVKVDPLAKLAEVRPATASITTHLDGYEWGDDLYMKTHWATKVFGAPMNIYEVHAGSWRRDPANPDRFLNWDELSERLIPYLKEMGYTHVEFLPLAEHPLDESWGYQVTGYYSPTSRYGTPDQFRHFVDLCHQNEIGVILDWVPAHFPKDAHALGRFDGTACYEHADPRQGEHPHWGTYIFNLGRNEVKNFLIANAMYWLKEFHCDGLRVDAVASMLYLDYGKGPGEWVPNKDGGNINYDTLEFLKHLNSIMGRLTPHAILIAEESTSFPSITRPPEQGGLGFHYKWNMGWMNDTLEYMKQDFPYRSYHHNKLTFSLTYAYSENFILPLSHDEVVHGKASLIGRMPGDTWRQFAGSRLLMMYQMTHPGKKLRFMGHEIAQFIEWREYEQLEWFLLE